MRNKPVRGPSSSSSSPAIPRPRPLPQALRAAAEAGADVIEIGIPFSDPLADGPVIQAAVPTALSGTASPPAVCSTSSPDFRQNVATPIVLMTCYNPIFRFGVDGFR